jgi:hypothetical protein
LNALAQRHGVSGTFHERLHETTCLHGTCSIWTGELTFVLLSPINDAGGIRYAAAKRSTSCHCHIGPKSIAIKDSLEAYRFGAVDQAKGSHQFDWACLDNVQTRQNTRILITGGRVRITYLCHRIAGCKKKKYGQRQIQMVAHAFFACVTNIVRAVE